MNAISNALPVGKRVSAAKGFEGNIAPSGSEYLTDGCCMIRKSAIERHRKAIDKRQYPNGRSVDNAPVLDMWRSKTANLPHKVELQIDGYVEDDHIRRLPENRNLAQLYPENYAFPVFVNQDRLALLVQSTGATTAVIQAPDQGQKANEPVVLLRDDSPVAILMPVQQYEASVKAA
jgi:hypothetical protein